jgi:hypothetical protein
MVDFSQKSSCHYEYESLGEAQEQTFFVLHMHSKKKLVTFQKNG